jgi:hypothetical protein
MTYLTTIHNIKHLCPAYFSYYKNYTKGKHYQTQNVTSNKKLEIRGSHVIDHEYYRLLGRNIVQSETRTPEYNILEM